jgi:hypothetical protein
MCAPLLAQGPRPQFSPPSGPRVDRRGGRSPSMFSVVSLPKALFWHGFPRNAEEAVRMKAQLCPPPPPPSGPHAPIGAGSSGPVFRLGIIYNRIAIPYVTLYTTFRGWDAVSNGQSRGVGQSVRLAARPRARCGGMSDGGFPTALGTDRTALQLRGSPARTCGSTPDWALPPGIPRAVSLRQPLTRTQRS